MSCRDPLLSSESLTAAAEWPKPSLVASRRDERSPEEGSRNNKKRREKTHDKRKRKRSPYQMRDAQKQKGVEVINA